MKTNPNDNEPSKAAGKNKPASKDNKTRRKYKVELYLWRNGVATATVEARSMADAHFKAEGLLWEDVDEWIPFDYDYLIKSIEPIKEGGSHE